MPNFQNRNTNTMMTDGGGYPSRAKTQARPNGPTNFSDMSAVNHGRTDRAQLEAKYNDILQQLQQKQYAPTPRVTLPQNVPLSGANGAKPAATNQRFTPASVDWLRPATTPVDAFKQGARDAAKFALGGVAGVVAGSPVGEAIRTMPAESKRASEMPQYDTAKAMKKRSYKADDFNMLASIFKTLSEQ